MHHHHSPRNSAGGVRCSSSPSPVEMHKRRYKVDEIQGEMNNIKPPTFDGEHKKDEDADVEFLMIAQAHVVSFQFSMNLNHK